MVSPMLSDQRAQITRFVFKIVQKFLPFPSGSQHLLNVMMWQVLFICPERERERERERKRERRL